MICPGSVFLSCWPEVYAATASDRLDAENFGCPPTDQTDIEQAVNISDGNEAGSILERLIEKSIAYPRKTRLALLLQIMRSIDRAFGLIHPRSFQGTGHDELTDWLLTANDLRRQTGAYATNNSLHLIPRGPLTREQRDELASYADTLEDRFACITAVQDHLFLDGTRIEVRLSPVVDEDPLKGVCAGESSPGVERICVVPVAEKFDDLTLTPLLRSNRRYLEIGPSPKINPAKVLLSALKTAGKVDIALAPEFIMTPDAHEELLYELRRNPATSRLILAGTTNTAERVDGLPWNEAVVVNHLGIELWRQRKLWPSMLDEHRAKTYKIENDAGEGPYHEHNTSGSCIHVVDIDTIGRCVILICQDVENTLAENLISCLQPDWVFVPILDRGFAVNSWFINRARSLSKVSKARLVGACSTALPRKDGQDAFCLTIMCASSGDVPGGLTNATAFKKAAGSPGFAIHHFGTDKWQPISNYVEDPNS